MDWMTTFKALAPTVASAFLGPFSGIAVSAIGSILGVSEATQDKIAQAIQTGQLTPEQLSEIKKLELEYKNNEKERGFRYAELEFRDKDSARTMQIQTKSNVPAMLAGSVTLGFFGILIFLVANSNYKPTEPLLVMLGSLGTAWTGIIAFYFGSSSGSQSKDRVIAEMTAK